MEVAGRVSINGVAFGDVFALSERQDKWIGRTIFLVMFAMYVYIVLIITVLSRKSNPELSMVVLKPFGTIRREYWLIKVAIENVMLFIPFGCLMRLIHSVKIRFVVFLLISIAASFTIETLQIVTSRGNFEIDDIMTNMLGAIIGYMLSQFMI